MADTTASVSIWHLRAEDIRLTPNKSTPDLLRLDLGDDVHLVLRHDRDATAEAAAMRRLAEVATEAAKRLECAEFRRSLRGATGDEDA